MKLIEICEIESGLWKGKKEPLIEVNVIRNTNFGKDGKLNFDDIAKIKVERSQFLKKQLEFGDIIVEKSGGGEKTPVGRVCVFEKKDTNFTFSNFTSVLRIKNEKICNYMFLYHYLNWLFLSGRTEKIQTYSTGIRNLKLSKYKNIEIPLPNLSKQLEIVTKLNSIIEKIDKSKSNIKKKYSELTQLKLSILKNAVNNE
jgi:type I restriction enzyme S subunit